VARLEMHKSMEETKRELLFEKEASDWCRSLNKFLEWALAQRYTSDNRPIGIVTSLHMDLMG
jgi:hypothetical protein